MRDRLIDWQEYARHVEAERDRLAAQVAALEEREQRIYGWLHLHAITLRDSTVEIVTAQGLREEMLKEADRLDNLREAFAATEEPVDGE